jgi:hypothetical protein
MKNWPFDDRDVPDPLDYKGVYKNFGKEDGM